jgi:hypothetical protein
LFYALSQAGRAIAASYLPDRWRLRGHGLTCPDLDVEDPLSVQIKLPKPDEKNGIRDSFRRVSEATGSEIPHRDVGLGEVWAALPEVGRLLAGTSGFDGWLQPLIADPDEPGTSPLWQADRVPVKLVGVPFQGPEAITELLGSYAHAETLDIDTMQGVSLVIETTPYGNGVRVHWPSDSPDLAGRRNTLDRVVPLAVGGQRWLRPKVAGAVMNDLMMWWVVLFALSMLARYEPAGWVAALDLDRPLGARLVRLLDAAVDTIPELVLRELEPSYVMSDTARR